MCRSASNVTVAFAFAFFSSASSAVSPTKILVGLRSPILSVSYTTVLPSVTRITLLDTFQPVGKRNPEPSRQPYLFLRCYQLSCAV